MGSGVSCDDAGLNFRYPSPEIQPGVVSHMPPDPITHLCAILCGRSDLPAGTAGESVLEYARRHRVDRLVAWRAKRIDDALRFEVVLDQLYVRELNRVLAALEDHGVFPIVFKGAAIAHTHYEASWHRPRVDADVLIPADQRERAHW